MVRILFISSGNLTNSVSIFLAMAYSVPLVPNYVYVVIRLIMAESINSLVGSTLLCHYGETHDVFPIGDLVQPGETLIAAAIRHCRHLVNFRIEQNDRLYIAKKLDGFMDREPIKITIFITDALFNRLKWRARHHTPALAVAVTDSINEDVLALEQLPGPIPPIDLPTSLTTKICGIFDNFGIYHWDDFIDKSRCFDYGDFVTTREIEDSIGAYAVIVPTLMDNIHMRKKKRKKSLTKRAFKGHRVLSGYSTLYWRSGSLVEGN